MTMSTTPGSTEIPAEQESSSSQSSDLSAQVSSSAVGSISQPIQRERPQQVAVIVDPGNCSSSPNSTAVSQTTQSSMLPPQQPSQAMVEGTQQAEIPADISTTTSPYFQHEK